MKIMRILLGIVNFGLLAFFICSFFREYNPSFEAGSFVSFGLLVLIFSSTIIALFLPFNKILKILAVLSNLVGLVAIIVLLIAIVEVSMSLIVAGFLGLLLLNAIVLLLSLRSQEKPADSGERSKP